jgi:hypothetical protein
LEQYEKLICEPLKSLNWIDKIVVVIDALDECDDYEEILKALSMNNMPANIRIIVTTRPECDILERLKPHTHILFRPLELTEAGIEDDIHKYFASQFKESEVLPLGVIDISLLTLKANGLFQWASTACRYITNQPNGTGRRPAGTNTRKRYEAMLNSDDKLDGLYRAILLGVLTSDTEEREPVFTALATILATSVPLPLSTLKELCATDEERDIIDTDIPMLGSVLDIRDSEPVRPLHTSFRDFLTNRERSNEFFVDIIQGHRTLALGVLTEMNRELHFNMFHIRTSDERFTSVPENELHSILAPASTLHYSCRYWTDHIKALDAPCAPHIKQQANKFMTEKLLSWLEVICALKCLDIATRGLEGISGSPLVGISIGLRI